MLAAGLSSCGGVTCIALSFIPHDHDLNVPAEGRDCTASEALDAAKIPNQSFVVLDLSPDVVHTAALIRNIGDDVDRVLVPARGAPGLVAYCEVRDRQPFCEAARSFKGIHTTPAARAAFDRAWRLRSRICDYNSPYADCSPKIYLSPALDNTIKAAGVASGQATRVLDLEDAPDGPYTQTKAQQAESFLAARVAGGSLLVFALATLVVAIVLSRRRAKLPVSAK